MKRFTIRILIALLTFVVGVGAFIGWFLLGRSSDTDISASQSVVSNVRNEANARPRPSWEEIFFRYIDKHTDLVGLSKLRSADLAQDDVEVRVWFGFGLSPLEGLILKRVSGQWSALNLVGDDYYEPKKVKQKKVPEPKSGWDTAWDRLVNAGIRTLPDSSEIDYDAGGPDGWGYVVEIREGSSYRTYHYQVPEYSKRDEAKRMLELGNIIGREFNLPIFAAKKISD